MKTIEIIGPGGRQKVAEKDLDMYLRKGYTVVDGQAAIEEETKDNDDGVLDIVEEVKKLKTNSDVKKFCEDEELEISLEDYSNIQERKAAIIDILINRG